MTRTIRTPSLDAAKPAIEAASATERLLGIVGVDPSLVDCVFGDLAEERAEHAARYGRVLAALWYAEQAVRSMPHLLLSAFRYGGPRARARLAAALSIVAIGTAAAGAAIVFRDGPPARIVPDLANAKDGIVVNNVKPVQLPLRVLDKHGHRLASQPVHFAWASGAPIAVSPTGEIKCGIAGDATVHASSGAATADIRVRCRPVDQIETSTWVDLIAGDPPRDLPFNAIGLDGRPVLQLRGAVRVGDSSVVSYDGSTIRPRGVGETIVAVDVGDRTGRMRVIVHEMVRSFVSLKPNQRNVAMAIHVTRGDTVHWALPAGVFWLKFLPSRANETPPTITVEGNIVCSTGDGIRVYRMPLEEYGKYCFARTSGASVLVAHGVNGAPIVDGALLLQRVSP